MLFLLFWYSSQTHMEVKCNRLWGFSGVLKCSHSYWTNNVELVDSEAQWSITYRKGNQSVFLWPKSGMFFTWQQPQNKQEVVLAAVQTQPRIDREHINYLISVAWRLLAQTICNQILNMMIVLKLLLHYLWHVQKGQYGTSPKLSKLLCICRRVFCGLACGSMLRRFESSFVTTCLAEWLNDCLTRFPAHVDDSKDNDTTLRALSLKNSVST